MKLPKPPVGPKLTRKHLQELTDLTAWDGRKYHDDLPPGFPEGHKQNLALKQALTDAFLQCKDIDLNDPNGSPWFLAWRMYPNADHPMWKEQEGHEDCGCNCGCFIPR